MQEDRTVEFYMNRFFRRYEMGELASQMKVERIYRAVVGDFVSRLTTSVVFTQGTLRVRVLSAALRQELTMRREQLRQRINHELGSDMVQKISVG